MKQTFKTTLQYIQSFPEVTCLVDASFCELPYLHGILHHLSSWPFFKDHEFVITDHLTPIPNPHSAMVVFYLSNEDHRIPEYVNDVKLVLTPYPPQNGHPKVEGIPLGHNGRVPLKPVKPVHERTLEVFFSGRKINRRKAFSEGIQALEKLHPERVEAIWTKGFEQGLDPEAYAKNLANYSIVPAPEGNFSNISFRLFEAMRQGCVVLAPPLPDTWFFRQFPGITVKDWHRLPSIVEGLLNDVPRMQSIQELTSDFYLKNCSETAVAHQIANTLEGRK